MRPWPEHRLAYLRLLAGLAPGTVIRVAGGDPGDRASQGHSAAWAVLRATVVGAVAWTKGQVKAGPRLADVALEEVGSVAWRDGAAAQRAHAFAVGGGFALVTEDQVWGFARRAADGADDGEDDGGAGGRFRSLKGLAQASGALAGGAQAGGCAHVYVAQAATWKACLGRHTSGQDQKRARDASQALMAALGAPARIKGRMARHDYAAAVALAVVGLGVVSFRDQVQAPEGSPLATWIRGC